MNSLDELAEQLRCQAVVLTFVAHFDDGHHAAMEELFAPDGVWLRRDGEIRGRDGLRAFLAARDRKWRTRHVLTNIRTVLHGADHAAVHSYVTAYRGPVQADGQPSPMGLPFIIGACTDELRKIAGRWLISGRRMTDDFK